MKNVIFLLLLFIIIIIIINFKLRVGFHPVAVALQNDTQTKHNTNKTYYIQNTDNIHIKYTKHTYQI
jgi:hypothetical protein